MTTAPLHSSSTVTAARSTPGISEHASLDSECGSIGSTAPGTYTLVARRRASRSIGEPSGTCAATSAMCTHTRAAPPSIASAEIASSKSRALAGSMVNVGSARRSRRSYLAWRTRSPAARASRSTAGSNARARPRSSISPSITSRATSGRPSTRRIRAPDPRPCEPRPPAPRAGWTSTRSPARALPRAEPGEPTTICEEPPRRGEPSRGCSYGNSRSAVRKRPRRSSTATIALAGAGPTGSPAPPAERR